MQFIIGVKLRDIMRPGPWTIDADAPLGIARRMMNRNRIRHLPVLRAGKLVGMISERDILGLRAITDGEDWWSTPVHAAMQSPVHTAHADDAVIEAAGRMATAKIGALPIVDLGKVIGIVTVSDVLDAEVREAMAPRRGPEAIVADAMTAWPRTVAPETKLVDAVAMMVDHDVRHLPVVDSTHTIVGMLSERDVRTSIGDPLSYVEQRSASDAQFLVRDAMSRPAVLAQFDRPLVEVATAFADHRMGALPVVDKFGALIGIISYVDVLRMLTR